MTTHTLSKSNMTTFFVVSVTMYVGTCIILVSSRGKGVRNCIFPFLKLNECTGLACILNSDNFQIVTWTTHIVTQTTKKCCLVTIT